MIDHLTFIRLATLTASECKNEEEFAEKLLGFIKQVGEDLLSAGKMSDSQIRGVQEALNNTPIAFQEMQNILASLPIPEGHRANLVFILARMIDDMLSLGATAMTAGNMDIGFAVKRGGKNGGNKSADTRREKQREWQNKTLTLANEICQKNSKLTHEDLATKIIERWPSEAARLPGRKPVIEFISQKRRAGDIPPRT